MRSQDDLSDPNWQLAQINVGRLTAPSGDPTNADFFAALDRINAVAEATEGFVWRLQDASGNATGIRASTDPLFAVNMSVWRDPVSLVNFVFRSAHPPFVARRREFFESFPGAYQALWWVPSGHRPSVDEGLSRLWHIDRYGATPHAFTFKQQFPPASTS